MAARTRRSATFILDGYDFLTKQKEIPKFSKIPVIVMSGEEEIALREMKFSPTAILKKPLNIS